MMDRLRQDLRTVFDRQQEGLGDLAGVRQRVLRSALEKRDESIGRRTPLVAGIAAALIAVLLVATFAYVRAGNRIHVVSPPVPGPSPISNPSPPPPPTPSPNPFAGLHRSDVDLVDSARAWTLLSNCNAAAPGSCNYFVAATVDGAQTWSKPVQVGPAFDSGNGDAPRMIRFINADDGFVYGHESAFITHDGGKTWTRLDLHATYFPVISGRGKAVWALTNWCVKGMYCPFEARLSSDGGRTWSSPQPMALSSTPFDAIVFGTSGLLVSTVSGEMAITFDSGRNWRSINSRCGGNAFRAWVATSDGNKLWELCMGNPKTPAVVASTPAVKPPSGAGTQFAADKELFMSQDGGLSWSQKGTSQVGGRLPVLGSQVSLVSNRPDDLLLGTDSTPILLTTDSGSSWKQVQDLPAGIVWLRFISPQVGWAMEGQGAIWSTTDGGTSWSWLPGHYSGP